jgi:hypothetical protein
MDVYGNLLDAAIEQDREAAIRYSNELGYFTGQESEASLSCSAVHTHTYTQRERESLTSFAHGRP